MDQSNMYGSPLSDVLLGYTNSQVIAEPVQNSDIAEFGVDLSRVKEEPGSPNLITHASMFSEMQFGDVADVKPQVIPHQCQKTPTKVSSKRGRKPQLVAYGKSGEKLEKRREQNRRAAATYREKQRRKRKDVEETYAKLEATNAKQRKENEELLKLKEQLEAQLKAHQASGSCYMTAGHDHTPRVPSDSLCTFGCPNMNSFSPTMGMNMQMNVQFQNPMALQVSQVPPQPTKDQSLAPSPYTPKSEQMFLFDGFDTKQQLKASTPPLRLHSPASVLSASPEPPPYQPKAMSLPATLPPFSTVLSGVNHTLADPLFDSERVEDVVEFLRENFH